jgi:hypothetical protein
MAALFQRDKSVVSRHLRNVFQTGELMQSAVGAKNATTAADGKAISGQCSQARNAAVPNPRSYRHCRT